MKIIRIALAVAGTLFLLIGIIGIFIPILPTTPFLLLSAVCYANSFKKYYHWLLNTKWIGNYIKNYQEGKGISLRAKLFSISLLWFTIMFSVVFVLQNFFIRIVLIAIAISVTFH
ncbi:MAG: YbaN family protein, partial [Candidatus Hydrogenedentes bacterium]|nr:YbaN family protein [Candidatus Hydrogenedentota bacterium]